MKKFICLLLALLTTIAFAGCSCSGGSSNVEPEGSFWLNQPLVLTVPTEFSESAEYLVTVTKSEASKITPNLSGTYSYSFDSRLDGSGASFYQLDSHFTLKGTYTYKDTVYPVDDEIHSTIIFNGVDQKLKPIRSIKLIETTSPVVDGKGETTFENYNFQYVVDYTKNSGKDAVVSYTDLSESQNSPFPDTKTFGGYFSSSFCDNELLTIYPRMFKRDDDFSLSLKVLNPANQAKETININTRAFEATLKENCWDNGDLLVDCLDFTKSGTYTGIPMTCYYASNQGKKLDGDLRANQSYYKHALVKMETGIANVGTMTYTLTSFVNSQNA